MLQLLLLVNKYGMECMHWYAALTFVMGMQCMFLFFCLRSHPGPCRGEVWGGTESVLWMVACKTVSNDV